MKYYEKVLEDLTLLRERNISGKLNCIPIPFNRLSNFFPGIERGKYIILTASQKVGKSKLADKMFIYYPLFYSLSHPNELRLKIFYFSLEMSKAEKYREMMCHILYYTTKGRIHVSTTELKSIKKGQPIPISILEKLNSEEYRRIMDFFEDTVEIIEDIKNPTGINKYLRDYAKNHGTFHYKKSKVKEGNNTIEVDSIDYYEQDDPEEYRIVIIDNASNLSQEAGMNKADTINKMSQYNITLKKQLNYTICLIQHQAQAQEGIENYKLKKIKPSSDGLADCKLTSRDVNMLIGLYSPFKYGFDSYEGYNIMEFKNNIRFMEILEDRDYGSGGVICPLFFDGATGDFIELPRPEEKELEIFKVRAKMLQNANLKTSLITLKLKNISNGNNLCNLWRFWRRKNKFNHSKS